MNTKVKNELQAWKDIIKPYDFVFTNPRTKNAYTDIRKPWESLVKDSALVDFRFHDCRHDFCSRLVQDGVEMEKIRELARHSSMDITLRYAHLRPSQLKDAVERLV